MPDLLTACRRDQSWLIAFVRELVAHESPSTDVAALERCATWLSAALREQGAEVERLPGAPTADHVLARWRGDGARVLLLGHFDTVWPVGQIARMPIEARDGRLSGPGVLDMKAGLGIGVLAAKVLRSTHDAGSRPAITMLATSDEEVGSGTSRAAIEQLARDSDAVLVLEPAMSNGAVKTARKGVGEFEIVAHGISAHAGVSPGAGASAIHEIARQVAAIERLSDPERGLTINVGVIEGGTRSNVVAEQARAVVDVRVARLEDGPRIETAIRGLAPIDSRVRLAIRGSVSRPPMERTDGVARLFEIARGVAARMGWQLQEGATGGASDGNFTTAIGVPTLDGLGATGNGPHALHEHVIVDDLPVRAALLAGIIQEVNDRR